MTKHYSNPLYSDREEADPTGDAPAVPNGHPTERENTDMPTQSDFSHENADFAYLSEIVRSLLMADGSQNIEAVRDDILLKITECASAAHNRATVYMQEESTETAID
ncbi:MAG: hypothetical protein VB027_07375 [Gordonibacter sp.]|nr:hypothetical protein [Gordonibacter sp.]